jgi:hypothetical protein
VKTLRGSGAVPNFEAYGLAERDKSQRTLALRGCTESLAEFSHGLDPLQTFKIGPMNGREGRGSDPPCCPLQIPKGGWEPSLAKQSFFTADRNVALMHESLAQMELGLTEIEPKIAGARVLLTDQREGLELLSRNARNTDQAEDPCRTGLS